MAQGSEGLHGERQRRLRSGVSKQRWPTGEGYFFDKGVTAKCFTERRGVLKTGRENVQHSWGKASFRGQLGKSESGQGSLR